MGEDPCSETKVANMATMPSIGALTDKVHKPRTLLVLGHNTGMGTAAGADDQFVKAV